MAVFDVAEGGPPLAVQRDVAFDQMRRQALRAIGRGSRRVMVNPHDLIDALATVEVLREALESATGRQR
jgi:hypothetical protein